LSSTFGGLPDVDGELLGVARGLVMMKHGDERFARFSLPNS
jgi:hypothetical protein